MELRDFPSRPRVIYCLRRRPGRGRWLHAGLSLGASVSPSNRKTGWLRGLLPAPGLMPLFPRLLLVLHPLRDSPGPGPLLHILEGPCWPPYPGLALCGVPTVAVPAAWGCGLCSGAFYPGPQAAGSEEEAGGGQPHLHCPSQGGVWLCKSGNTGLAPTARHLWVRAGALHTLCSQGQAGSHGGRMGPSEHVLFETGQEARDEAGGGGLSAARACL